MIYGIYMAYIYIWHIYIWHIYIWHIYIWHTLIYGIYMAYYASVKRLVRGWRQCLGCPPLPNLSDFLPSRASGSIWKAFSIRYILLAIAIDVSYARFGHWILRFKCAITFGIWIFPPLVWVIVLISLLTVPGHPRFCRWAIAPEGFSIHNSFPLWLLYLLC